MTFHLTFNKVLAGISFIVILVIFLFFIGFRIMILFYQDADIGGYEYELMYEIQRLIVHKSLFSDPEQPPYLIVQKTPLYHYLVAGISKILVAVDQYQTLTPYYVSRALSLGVNLLSTVLIFFIGVYRLKLTKPIAAMSAMTVFITFSPHYYSRMDALLFLLFLGIVYILLSDTVQVKQILLLALLTALALWVKQNGSLYAILVLVMLWTDKEQISSRIFYYLSALVVFTGILGIYFLQDSSLTAVYQNIVYGLAIGRHLGDLWRIMTSETYGVLVPISVYIFYRSRHLSVPVLRKLSQLHLFCILSALFFLLNRGSGVNYLTEWRMVVILTLGYLVIRSPKHSLVSNRSFFWVILLFFSFARGKELQVEYAIGEYYHTPGSYNTQLRLARYLAKRVQPEDNIYCLNSDNFFNVLLPENVIFPVKIVVRSIVRHNPGLFDYSRFLDERNQGLITFLINKSGTKLVDPCFGGIFSSFELELVVGEYELWRFERCVE